MVASAPPIAVGTHPERFYLPERVVQLRVLHKAESRVSAFFIVSFLFFIFVCVEVE
jgi:hypothetical protein